MSGDHNNREADSVWDQLLSRQRDQIRAAYFDLSADERTSVFNHLVRMTSETGWHEEQRISAQAALQAISDS